MNLEYLKQDILDLEVFDTHSHLVGDALCAEDFWKLGEYFWLLRELQAAGYPKNPEELPEDKRMEAYAKAFKATRNTSMNWVMRQIMKDLYGIEITDVKSIKAADEIIKASAKDTNRPIQIADKIKVRKIVVNNEQHANFKNMDNTAVLIPRIDGKLNNWIKDIFEAKDANEAGVRIVEEINELLSLYKMKGCNCIMTTLPRFNVKTFGNGSDIKVLHNNKDEITVFVLHRLSEAAERNNMLFQLFLGVEHNWCSRAVPSNQTERITSLFGLFEKYACNFEIVVASEVNQMDAVQAANIFTNVSVGGPWWYNFRKSIFMDSMQKRFEALPPSTSSLVVSDARCIEWCYGKVLLIKHLTAEFLKTQVEEQWISREEAVWIAGDWLYNSAAARYKVL